MCEVLSSSDLTSMFIHINQNASEAYRARGTMVRSRDTAVTKPVEPSISRFLVNKQHSHRRQRQRAGNVTADRGEADLL